MCFSRHEFSHHAANFSLIGAPQTRIFTPCCELFTDWCSSGHKFSHHAANFSLIGAPPDTNFHTMLRTFHSLVLLRPARSRHLFDLSPLSVLEEPLQGTSWNSLQLGSLICAALGNGLWSTATILGKLNASTCDTNVMLDSCIKEEGR